MGHGIAREHVRILLLDEIDESVVGRFADAGYTQVEYLTGSLTEEALIATLERVHVVGLRSRTRLGERVLKSAEALIAIGCFCAGTSHVHLPTATSLGIPVFNAPHENTRSVAELVVAEAIILLRRIPAKNQAAHRGEWQKSSHHSFEARGKVLGIIGYGNVGSQLSVLAEALGMRVVFYDIEDKLPQGNARRAESLEDVLTSSDVISLHIPETPETRNMIGARELASMRPSSILINSGRGSVVVTEDLVQALSTGHLSGAAIDVFPEEPRSSDEPFCSPLRGFDNVLLTPHIGGSTVEAQRSSGRRVADSLIRYLDTGSTPSSVNFSGIRSIGWLSDDRTVARNGSGRIIVPGAPGKTLIRDQHCRPGADSTEHVSGVDGGARSMSQNERRVGEVGHLQLAPQLARSSPVETY